MAVSFGAQRVGNQEGEAVTYLPEFIYGVDVEKKT